MAMAMAANQSATARICVFIPLTSRAATSPATICTKNRRRQSICTMTALVRLLLWLRGLRRVPVVRRFSPIGAIRAIGAVVILRCVRRLSLLRRLCCLRGAAVERHREFVGSDENDKSRRDDDEDRQRRLPEIRTRAQHAGRRRHLFEDDVAAHAAAEPARYLALLSQMLGYALPAGEQVAEKAQHGAEVDGEDTCLLYTSPSPRDGLLSR